MSSEKKKPRRSFSVIFRLMLIVFALIFVFFLSFFLTIAVKNGHPIDYINSEYFEKQSADKIIDEYANEKHSSNNKDNSNDLRDNKSGKTSSNDLRDEPERKTLSESKTLEEHKQEDKTSESDRNSTASKDSVDTKRKIDGSTLSGKIERITSIKDAVNEQMRAKKNYVKLEDIPRSLRQAIVAVEDSRFYQHSGFDIGSIARAAVVNVEAGQIEEGASTITQQLVKNLFLSQEQSFTRKAEELLLAMNMERNFSKDEILEMYLNTIYFGSNFYGIYEASKGYFGVEPKDLTLAESTMLAGLPNAPSVYSPYVDFMLAKKRQLIVIDAMVKANILTEQEAEKAKIETIYLARDY